MNHFKEFTRAFSYWFVFPLLFGQEILGIKKNEGGWYGIVVFGYFIFWFALLIHGIRLLFG